MNLIRILSLTSRWDFFKCPSEQISDVLLKKFLVLLKWNSALWLDNQMCSLWDSSPLNDVHFTQDTKTHVSCTHWTLLLSSFCSPSSSLNAWWCNFSVMDRWTFSMGSNMCIQTRWPLSQSHYIISPFFVQREWMLDCEGLHPLDCVPVWSLVEHFKKIQTQTIYSLISLWPCYCIWIQFLMPLKV